MLCVFSVYFLYICLQNFLNTPRISVDYVHVHDKYYMHIIVLSMVKIIDFSNTTFLFMSNPKLKDFM